MGYRVAIVSYHAPPMPAVASHRVLRMTRQLLAAGHAVHWVTVDPERLAPRDVDGSLGALVPAGVRVHGIDGPALITKPVAQNLWEKVWRTVAWHAPRKLAFPDSFLSWQRRLKRDLPGLVRREHIDVVLFCCGPHNQILALPGLRAACPGVTILVDYRDLLSGNPWNVRSSVRNAAKVLEVERRMLRRADALFVNTHSARARFEEVVGPIEGLPVEVMRNAADYGLAAQVASDFDEPDLGPGIHLGFFGTLFPRRRLRPVLAAMAGLSDGELSKLTLHVYCDAHDSAHLLREDVDAVDARVEPRVVRHDLLGYGPALRIMQTVDMLVLVNGAEESDALFVPGKLYDYLMARRPVLFVGHPGEASEIVAATTGADRCFRHEEVAGITDALRAVLATRPADVEEAAEYDAATTFRPLLARVGDRSIAG